MPEYNIEYTVARLSAREAARREIAKVAARIFDDKGNHLYDLVKLYNSDLFIVDSFIDDSIRQVAARFPDVCVVSRQEKEGETPEATVLSFYLPDIEPVMIPVGEEELNRLIGNQVTAMWLSTRYPAIAQFYSEQASASLERLVIFLRTRKKPER